MRIELAAPVTHEDAALPPAIPMGKLRALRSILNDPWRKPFIRVAWELLGATVANRALPRFYLKSLLYRRDVKDWRAYLSDREERQIQELIRDTARRPYLDSKLLFHQYFRIPGVQLPRFLAYTVGTIAVLEGEYDTLATAADLGRLINRMRARFGVERIFVKPMGGIHGKQCFIIDGASRGADLETALNHLRSGSFLLEEVLTQHPALSDIYPGSINTLRVVTYTPPHQDSKVVSTLLRLGASGSCIDNASAGGVFVKVDVHTGSLAEYARRFYEFGGTVHFAHPDTGVPFAGCSVPLFQEALQMVLTAADHIGYRIVGWDVAITDRGPVLIEGNHNPHLFGAEIAEGGYKRNPVFAAFLRQAKLV